MKQTLIIGNTSQLSYYLPKEYIRISSRNIDYNFVKSYRWERVYILFAEQRTFLNENLDFFKKVNLDHTIEVIDKIRGCCENIFVFCTSELWNKHQGPIDVSTQMNFYETPYVLSKKMLHDKIMGGDYPDVKIVYPFNFNSPHRTGGFLWAKIMCALTSRKKIEVDCLNFSRDIIHPSALARQLIKTNTHRTIGSGQLINIKKISTDLFLSKGLDINEYIITKNSICDDKNYYNLEILSDYEELKSETLKDLKI